MIFTLVFFHWCSYVFPIFLMFSSFLIFQKFWLNFGIHFWPLAKVLDFMLGKKSRWPKMISELWLSFLISWTFANSRQKQEKKRNMIGKKGTQLGKVGRPTRKNGTTIRKDNRMSKSLSTNLYLFVLEVNPIFPTFFWSIWLISNGTLNR